MSLAKACLSVASFRSASSAGPRYFRFSVDERGCDDFTHAQIEELIDDLANRLAVVIVTHSMQQAARVSQKTAFFHMGTLVEFGDTDTIFTNPVDPRTESYITGRIG